MSKKVIEQMTDVAGNVQAVIAGDVKDMLKRGWKLVEAKQEEKPEEVKPEPEPEEPKPAAKKKAAKKKKG